MKDKILVLLKKATHLVEGTGVGKIKPLFKIYSRLLSLLKPRMVVTEGSKMYLDKHDTLLLSIYPNFEPYETRLVKKFVKKGMITVDAGANIGYYTLLMARLVGKKGMVHAFEPERENFDLLKRNVELNNYTNTRLNKVALSNKKGFIKLFLSPASPQDHRIFKTGDSKKFKKVKTITLDEYFKRSRRVDFIKMDIQGAEFLALKGARKTLSSNKELKMVLEFWPDAIRQAGGSPEELLDILMKQGNILIIDEKKEKLLPINNLEVLKPDSSQAQFNLFFEKSA